MASDGLALSVTGAYAFDAKKICSFHDFSVCYTENSRLVVPAPFGRKLHRFERNEAFSSFVDSSFVIRQLKHRRGWRQKSRHRRRRRTSPTSQHPNNP